MRKAAIAASGFALVLTLSACSGQEAGGQASPAGNSGSTSLFGSAQELVQAASAKTEQSKSAKFTMESSVAGQQVKGQGEGRFDGANTAMSMTMDSPQGTIEMRLVDKALYMKLPESVQSKVSSGKPWMKISADGNDPMSKMLGGSFDQMTEQSDPSKTLEQIQKAGTITKSEQTQLDGQPATHYTIDLDFDKIADMAPGGISKDAVQQLKGKVGKLPMELWLNADQLPLQVTIDMTQMMQAAGAGGTGTSTTTMKYTDWGAPVDVQAPPADQVGEFKLPG